MRFETLTGNIAKTVLQMQEQTGKQPGGPTGLCQKFVVGALTGADIDFTSRPETLYEQIKDEARAGLVRHTRELNMQISILPIRLRQNMGASEALLISSEVYSRSRLVRHLIAIVPTVVHPYCVVDSLLTTGISFHQEPSEVEVFVQERFYSKLVDLSTAFIKNEE